MKIDRKTFHAALNASPESGVSGSIMVVIALLTVSALGMMTLNQTLRGRLGVSSANLAETKARHYNRNAIREVEHYMRNGWTKAQCDKDGGHLEPKRSGTGVRTLTTDQWYDSSNNEFIVRACDAAAVMKTGKCTSADMIETRVSTKIIKGKKAIDAKATTAITTRGRKVKFTEEGTLTPLQPTARVAPQAAITSNNLICTSCHLQINGDVVSLNQVDMTDFRRELLPLAAPASALTRIVINLDSGSHQYLANFDLETRTRCLELGEKFCMNEKITGRWLVNGTVDKNLVGSGNTLFAQLDSIPYVHTDHRTETIGYKYDNQVDFQADRWWFPFLFRYAHYLPYLSPWLKNANQTIFSRSSSELYVTPGTQLVFPSNTFVFRQYRGANSFEDATISIPRPFAGFSSLATIYNMSDSSITQNYTGLEMPLKSDGTVALPTFPDFEKDIAEEGPMDCGGKIQTPAKDEGPQELIGTIEEPIMLHGNRIIDGDLMIKGWYSGQGTLYVKGRVFIVGPLTAKNSFFRPCYPQSGDPDAFDRCLQSAANGYQAQRADFLGIAADNLIAIGRFDSFEKRPNDCRCTPPQNPYLTPESQTQARACPAPDHPAIHPSCSRGVFEDPRIPLQLDIDLSVAREMSGQKTITGSGVQLSNPPPILAPFDQYNLGNIYGIWPKSYFESKYESGHPCAGSPMVSSQDFEYNMFGFVSLSKRFSNPLAARVPITEYADHTFGSVHLVEAFLYSKAAVLGKATYGSYAINGGVMAPVFSMPSGALWCPASVADANLVAAGKIHGLRQDRNYVNYDYRLKHEPLKNKILTYLGQ